MTIKKYMSIVRHYEMCLKKFGDTHKGVDWPKKEDVDKRYEVMLDVINRPGEVTLLDFGCGASHLYGYILKHRLNNIKYSGLDISGLFIALSVTKYPSINYYCVDVLDSNIELPDFDYIIMNGVFTEKCNLSFDEMLSYFKEVIKQVFSKANIGIAFNAMSKQVDWERDDLFHLPLDILADFLTKNITRNFIIRNDYGLYEYTTYVYK